MRAFLYLLEIAGDVTDAVVLSIADTSFPVYANDRLFQKPRPPRRGNGIFHKSVFRPIPQTVVFGIRAEPLARFAFDLSPSPAWLMPRP